MRPVSRLREAFLGLANPLVVFVPELAARLPWFDSGSGLRDQLGKGPDVQSESPCERGDVVEPHDEVVGAKAQEVASRKRVLFGVPWY